MIPTESSDPSDVATWLAPENQAMAFFAPYLVGLMLAIFLSGTFLALYSAYKNELAEHTRAAKLVCHFVAALTVVNVAVCMYEIVNVSATQSRRVFDLHGSHISGAMPLFAGIIGLVCQSFLTARAALLIANRAYRLTFVAIAGFGILAAFSGAIADAAVNIQYTLQAGANFVVIVLPVSVTVAIQWWLWTSALTDIIISAALLLTLHARKAGFNLKTDNVIQIMMTRGLQTAAYTAIISLAAAACASAFGTDDFRTRFITWAFWPPLPALHALSLYTTITTRKVLSSHVTQTTSDPLPTNTFGVRSQGGGGGAGSKYPRGIGSGMVPLAINVKHEQTIHFDDAVEGYEMNRREKGRPMEADV